MARQVVRFDLVTQYNEAVRFYGCPEKIEELFDIEISCGDGIFLSDIIDGDDEELIAKYDGRVDETCFRMNGKIYTQATLHCKYDEDHWHNNTEPFTDVKIINKR